MTDVQIVALMVAALRNFPSGISNSVRRAGLYDSHGVPAMGAWQWDHLDHVAVATFKRERALLEGREARLARLPQDRDTSTLPLFGDAHKQQDLF